MVIVSRVSIFHNTKLQTKTGPYHDISLNDGRSIADGLNEEEFVAHTFTHDVVDQLPPLNGSVGGVIHCNHPTGLQELTHVLHATHHTQVSSYS